MSRYTLEQARDEFRIECDNESAALYLRALMDSQSEDTINDDAFFNGLADIEFYLSGAAVTQRS